MLIEFVGFSSSGKTSLIDAIQEHYTNDINIVELDYNKKRYVPGWQTPSLMILTDLRIFAEGGFFDIKTLYPLIKDIILQQTTLMRKIALIRVIIRKNILSKKYSSKRGNSIFIFDEGIVQACINIAVTSVDFNVKLQRHAKSIIDSTRPDLVIYLKPPNDQIIQRIYGRIDRKQWSNASSQRLNNYIQKFDQTIKQLYSHNLLVIDDPDVDSVINQIIEYTYSQGEL